MRCAWPVLSWSSWSLSCALCAGPPCRVNIDDMTVEELTPAHYLAFKEKLAAQPGETGGCISA